MQDQSYKLIDMQASPSPPSSPSPSSSPEDPSILEQPKPFPTAGPSSRPRLTSQISENITRTTSFTSHLSPLNPNGQSSTTSPSSGLSGGAGYFPPLGQGPIPHRFSSFTSTSSSGTLINPFHPRIPSEEARILSMASTPNADGSPSRPGSMILYRLATIDDVQEPLQPPKMPAGVSSRRSSTLSMKDNADTMSLISLNDDSKYPAHLRDHSGSSTPSGKRATSTFIPYAYDPEEDDSPPDATDKLHDPEGAFSKSRTFGWRGVLNITMLLSLVGGLLALFVVYPAVKFSHPDNRIALIVSNTRINSTGQAVGDDVPFDPIKMDSSVQIPLVGTSASTQTHAVFTPPLTTATPSPTSTSSNTDQDTLPTPTSSADPGTTSDDGTDGGDNGDGTGVVIRDIDQAELPPARRRSFKFGLAAANAKVPSNWNEVQGRTAGNGGLAWRDG